MDLFPKRRYHRGSRVPLFDIAHELSELCSTLSNTPDSNTFTFATCSILTLTLQQLHTKSYQHLNFQRLFSLNCTENKRCQAHLERSSVTVTLLPFNIAPFLRTCQFFLLKLDVSILSLMHFRDLFPIFEFWEGGNNRPAMGGDNHKSLHLRYQKVNQEYF